MAGNSFMSVFRGAGKFIGPIIEAVTPELRDDLVAVIQRWGQKAYATPNKWDDVLVDVISALLGITVEKPSKSKE